MITIVHGSDTAASRKFFNDQKQQSLQSISLEADMINLTDLTQMLDGGGLFGESKHIFIEQFITKKKKAADFKSIIAYLSEKATDNTIMLWEGKELEPANLRLIKNASPKVFKLPQTLFQLLDAIKPHNTAQLISLHKKTVEHIEAEILLSMLIRHFRIMIALSDTTQSATIEEVQKMRNNPSQQWIIGKMQRQANQFTIEKLLTLYNELYLIEVGQKTGSLTTDLNSTIDFFLLEV